MSMVFCSSDGIYCAHLLKGAIRSIQQEISIFHPLETGGILIGCYDENLRVATVHMATPSPPDSKHGKNFFVRGTKGIKETLIKAKIHQPSLHYIGEWHSHPSSSPEPSDTDMHQMKKFANTALYGSKSPLLLVVGGNLNKELTWSFRIIRSHRPPLPLLII